MPYNTYVFKDIHQLTIPTGYPILDEAWRGEAEAEEPERLSSCAGNPAAL